MLDCILQMRFVTFLVVIGCSSLFLLCYIYWDTPTISEREYDVKGPKTTSTPKVKRQVKEIRRFRLKYVENNVKVTLSGRRGKPKGWKRKNDLEYPPVILFHDTRKKKASSKVWQNLGTIKLITDLGYRAIAINMPGHGKTRLKGHMSGAEFTESVIKHLRLTRCILVVPGMSSVYAFPYLLDHTEEARKRVAGLVAMGTPHADAFTDQQFRNFKDIPTLYIQGENDNLSQHGPLNRFKEVPSGEIQIIPNSGYRVYRDQTEVFHRHLTHFLKKLSHKHP